MRIKKVLPCYFILAFLSGIALSVWRTVLMVRYYDPYNNEYAVEAFGQLEAIGLTLFFVLVLLATAAFVLRKFTFKPHDTAEHSGSVFTSALLGFVFLAVGIFVSLDLNVILENIQFPLFRYAQIVSYVLLFLCAVYFVVNATGNPRLEAVKRALSFVPPLWGVAFLLASHMDPAYNYKDFNHTLCNVAIGALTVFFLYETKAAVTGKASIAYFVFSLISLTASMVCMIPTFVLLAYWELSSNLNNLFEAVLLGSIFYTCACFFNLCKNVIPCEKKPKEKKEKAEEQNA